VEADFDVKFSASSDDVFSSGLIGGTLDQWVGLGEFLQSIDQLWKIGGVLWLNGDSDDGGDGIFHGSDGVGIDVIGNGSGLQEILIDSD